MENKNKSLNVLAGFAIGSALGATISLLLAPASGEETRSKIKAEVADAQYKAMSAIEDAQSRAIALVDGVKEDFQQRAIRLKNIGQRVFEDEKATVEQGVNDVKTTMDQGVQDAKQVLKS